MTACKSKRAASFTIDIGTSIFMYQTGVGHAAIYFELVLYRSLQKTASMPAERFALINICLDALKMIGNKLQQLTLIRRLRFGRHDDDSFDAVGI